MFFGNYFKISLNKKIYKMTLLPLPEIRGVTLCQEKRRQLSSYRCPITKIFALSVPQFPIARALCLVNCYVK